MLAGTAGVGAYVTAGFDTVELDRRVNVNVGDNELLGFKSLDPTCGGEGDDWFCIDDDDDDFCAGTGGSDTETVELFTLHNRFGRTIDLLIVDTDDSAVRELTTDGVDTTEDDGWRFEFDDPELESDESITIEGEIACTDVGSDAVEFTIQAETGSDSVEMNRPVDIESTSGVDTCGDVWRLDCGDSDHCITDTSVHIKDDVDFLRICSEDDDATVTVGDSDSEGDDSTVTVDGAVATRATSDLSVTFSNTTIKGETCLKSGDEIDGGIRDSSLHDVKIDSCEEVDISISGTTIDGTMYIRTTDEVDIDGSNSTVTGDLRVEADSDISISSGITVDGSTDKSWSSECNNC